MSSVSREINNFLGIVDENIEEIKRAKFKHSYIPKTLETEALIGGAGTQALKKLGTTDNAFVSRDAIIFGYHLVKKESTNFSSADDFVISLGLDLNDSSKVDQNIKVSKASVNSTNGIGATLFANLDERDGVPRSRIQLFVTHKNNETTPKEILVTVLYATRE